MIPGGYRRPHPILAIATLAMGDFSIPERTMTIQRFGEPRMLPQGWNVSGATAPVDYDVRARRNAKGIPYPITRRNRRPRR